MRPVQLKTQTDQDSEAVVAMLEGLLAEAREGKFVHAAFVSILRDGSSTSISTQGNGLQSLLGAITILQYRILKWTIPS